MYIKGYHGTTEGLGPDFTQDPPSQAFRSHRIHVITILRGYKNNRAHRKSKRFLFYPNVPSGTPAAQGDQESVRAPWKETINFQG